MPAAGVYVDHGGATERRAWMSPSPEPELKRTQSRKTRLVGMQGTSYKSIDVSGYSIFYPEAAVLMLQPFSSFTAFHLPLGCMNRS
jgi:hypothetical protein